MQSRTKARSRFVTGLVDSKQNSTYKVSMYEKANELDLPASFVEVRHEAIHGELPSLVVLRQAAERALRWLWDDYWRHLENDDASVSNSLRDTLLEILQIYLAQGTEITKISDQGYDRLPKHFVEDTAIKLNNICKGDKQALTELVSIFIDDEILLPRFSL
ncbi:MAG: hypothetical protein Q9170_004753 [Blastenia crenularia]